MIDHNTIDILYRNIEDLDTLFKPVQKEVLRKLREGQDLSENEKRYLRGKMGKRIKAIETVLRSEKDHSDGFQNIGLQDYYITGFEALKHNGFGWYYETKNITVINTRIKGSIDFGNKKFRYVRVKSLRNRDLFVDTQTGIKYASNEQILKDSRSLKNKALERAWWSMFNRYPDIFVKDKERFRGQNPIDEDVGSIDDYGV